MENTAENLQVSINAPSFVDEIKEEVTDEDKMDSP